MKNRSFLSILILIAVIGLIYLPGCSDDNSTNGSTGPRINMDLVPNALFTFNRTILDSLNNPVPGSTHSYTVNLKKGQTIIGAYMDWFYRIGTNTVTGKKDTLYVRVNTGSKNEASFSKEVQVYGFTEKVMREFVDMITTAFPIAPPAIPGPQWDIIAMFADNDGKAFDVGKEWTFGDPNGTDLSFNIQGFPVTVNVRFKGKVEAREETIAYTGKQAKAWKTSVTITYNILGTLNTAKAYMWWSDDPDGQVRYRQETSTFVLPFGLGSFPVPGETQDLVSYID